jgi:hypothetical protein
MMTPLRAAFGEWPFTDLAPQLTWAQREALRQALIVFEMPALSDVQIKELVKAASAGGILTRGGSTTMRIVKAVERYYGVDGTEALCPCCNRPVSSPSCSLNSDGAFHLDHPHNGARQGRLVPGPLIGDP